MEEINNQAVWLKFLSARMLYSMLSFNVLLQMKFAIHKSKIKKFLELISKYLLVPKIEEE